LGELQPENAGLLTFQAESDGSLLPPLLATTNPKRQRGFAIAL
jgi:hypothetical protein